MSWWAFKEGVKVFLVGGLWWGLQGALVILVWTIMIAFLRSAL